MLGLNIPFQFNSPRFDLISLGVTPIHLTSAGQIFGHGTGFIWKYSGRVFLITNWHNLAGQNPFDGSHLNEHGRIPHEITAYPALMDVNEANLASTKRDTIKFQLFEHFDKPKWLQHPLFPDLRIDIVAIELPTPNDRYVAINQMSFERVFTHVGSDLLIVGYPYSDFDPLMLPIWKRGSLASETLAGWRSRPAFLIDAASRPGMSGSPVFRRVFGPVAIPRGESFELKVDSVMATEFVGVYAGHLSGQDAAVTIGFAWYGKLVEEILASGSPGTRL